MMVYFATVLSAGRLNGTWAWCGFHRGAQVMELAHEQSAPPTSGGLSTGGPWLTTEYEPNRIE